VLVLLATRGLGVAVVVSERVDPSQHHISWPWHNLRRLTYRWADALVLQTRSALARFCSFGKGKAHVIPNPVTLPVESGENAPSRPSERTNRLLVAMGRLAVQKGFDLLLEAFKQASADRPNWTLTILGEGPMRAELEESVRRLGLTGQVRLPGQVHDPFCVLRQADLFVLSSRFEGFPNALCEAMACGLPVISFDCPSGPAEVIRDGVNGVLVLPEDVEGLTLALARLMDDEAERDRLGKRAPEVLDRFSVEKVMAEWDDLIGLLRRGKRVQKLP
jgi:glycosyltransferase involved in cell wall biosynthesis